MFGWLKRKETVSEPVKTRVHNSTLAPNGAGSQYDMGSMLLPGGLMLGADMHTRDRALVTLYHTAWEAQKIVDLPVEDILREGWTLTGLPDNQRDTLVTMDDRLGLIDALRRAETLERLQGGSAILMGIDDGCADASIPAGRGPVRFLNVISRYRVSNTELDSDPTSPGYGRPSHYWINGVRVHRSRLLLFDGNPLVPVVDPTVTPINFQRNDGFGNSVLIRVYDDIMRAIGTRQAAYQLVQRASVIIAALDVMDLSGSVEGEAAMRQLQEIVNQINLYRGAVVNQPTGSSSNPITTMAASFGSVPELLMSYLQVLSAGSDVPATRFLGQSPGGLNATGDSDLENYYGRLESRQRIKLRPTLLRYYRQQGQATFVGWDETSFDIEFPPLWSLSEVEQSTIRSQDTAGVVSLVTTGILTESEAIDQLKDRKVITIDIDTATDAEMSALNDYPADQSLQNPQDNAQIDAGQSDAGATAVLSGGFGSSGDVTTGADSQPF